MKVYELLDKPEKWIKGHLSLDSNKKLVEPTGEGAVSWCVLGALSACYNPEEWGKAFIKMHINVGGNVSIWNDAPERTYEEVIALCKELDI